MPKPVEHCVEKMMADKTFYPEKSSEERRSTAWGICTNLYKEGKLAKDYAGEEEEKKE